MEGGGCREAESGVGNVADPLPFSDVFHSHQPPQPQPPWDRVVHGMPWTHVWSPYIHVSAYQDSREFRHFEFGGQLKASLLRPVKELDRGGGGMVGSGKESLVLHGNSEGMVRVLFRLAGWKNSQSLSWI